MPDEESPQNPYAVPAALKNDICHRCGRAEPLRHIFSWSAGQKICRACRDSVRAGTLPWDDFTRPLALAFALTWWELLRRPIQSINIAARTRIGRSPLLLGALLAVWFGVFVLPISLELLKPLKSWSMARHQPLAAPTQFLDDIWRTEGRWIYFQLAFWLVIIPFGEYAFLRFLAGLRLVRREPIRLIACRRIGVYALGLAAWWWVPTLGEALLLARAPLPTPVWVWGCVVVASQWPFPAAVWALAAKGFFYVRLFRPAPETTAVAVGSM